MAPAGCGSAGWWRDSGAVRLTAAEPFGAAARAYTNQDSETRVSSAAVANTGQLREWRIDALGAYFAHVRIPDGTRDAFMVGEVLAPSARIAVGWLGRSLVRARSGICAWRRRQGGQDGGRRGGRRGFRGQLRVRRPRTPLQSAIDRQPRLQPS